MATGIVLRAKRDFTWEYLYSTSGVPDSEDPDWVVIPKGDELGFLDIDDESMWVIRHPEIAWARVLIEDVEVTGFVRWSCPNCQTEEVDNFFYTHIVYCENCGNEPFWDEILSENEIDVLNRAMEKGDNR